MDEAILINYIPNPVTLRTSILSEPYKKKTNKATAYRNNISTRNKVKLNSYQQF